MHRSNAGFFLVKVLIVLVAVILIYMVGEWQQAPPQAPKGPAVSRNERLYASYACDMKGGTWTGTTCVWPPN